MLILLNFVCDINFDLCEYIRIFLMLLSTAEAIQTPPPRCRDMDRLDPQLRRSATAKETFDLATETAH